MSILRQAVVATESELAYYKNVVKEQQEIIEQLTSTGQPKGYVYMHPYDVMELVNKVPTSHIIFGSYPKPGDDIVLGGRRIRQSPLIPAVTKNIK